MEIFVGRQPIYDRQRQVVAYELLYRPMAVNAANVIDGDRATAEVMLHTLTTIGLEGLVGHHPAFINITRNAILQGHLQVLPCERVVLEVLEDTVVDEPLLQALRDLKAAGYRIALDDFVLTDDTETLLSLAHIIKIDLLHTPMEQVAALVERFRPLGLALLAEKIETREIHQRCLELGFDYFQGYHFSQPQLMRGHSPSTTQASLLPLLARINDPRISLKELKELIERDPVLSYRLLRYINSAFFCLPQRVDSVQRVVTLLGVDNVRAWSTLLALATLEEGHNDLATTALIRAYLCQILAQKQGLEAPESAFIVGLLSILDAMLEMPMSQVLEQLPLSDDISMGLLEGEGPYGTLLTYVRDYEREDLAALEHCPIPFEILREAYLQAVTRTEAAMSGLG